MATLSPEKELYDPTFEQLLLHDLVFRNDRHRLIQYCYPPMFHSEYNKEVFSGIKFLDGRCDLLSLVDLLVERFSKKKEDLDKGYTEYDITYFLSKDPVFKYHTPDTYDVYNIIRRLKELLFRRIIFERAGNLARIAETSPVETCNTEVISEVNKIITLERKLLKAERHTIEKISKETAEKINTKGDIVETGFNFINTRLSGLTRKSISSLLAKPKHFKSSFSDDLVATTVEKSSYTGLIISLEDPVEERIKRIIAGRLGISLRAMRFKEITVEPQDIEGVLKSNLHSKLHVIDVKDVLTPDDAVTAIMDIKPDLFCIDHIQKFMMDDMVLGIIRAVKSIEVAANRTNSHGFITSQVSDKKILGRKDQVPEASDAQWTSALYQSSTEMFSLYYPYQVSKNPFEMNLLNFRILAARYSNAVGDLKLEIDPDHSKVKGEINENNSYIG